mmetsp:Transcript_10937/g.37206  ORF Transcript_10937/g.37206 Transcript_10937/m.37206 type:complete len:163 (+) Transcript_10937:871-1359(+)
MAAASLTALCALWRRPPRRAAFGRYMSSGSKPDGADPDPPDFSALLNELSAQSAAAVGPKPEIQHAPRKPPSGPVVTGRVHEMELRELLLLEQAGTEEARAKLQRVLQKAEIDPDSVEFRSAVGVLAVPVVSVGEDGKRVGRWPGSGTSIMEELEGDKPSAK